jgi:outer membrane protein TolC
MRWLRHFGESLLVPLLLVVTLASARTRADDADPQSAGPERSVPSISVAPAQRLNLAECLEQAQQRQPRIAVQRASLAAAEDGKRALESLRIPEILDRSIPVRLQQATVGLTAAAANLDQAERETVYAVTRTYFTVLYAREQERVTKSVVERLSAVQKTVQEAVNAGAANYTTTDVNRTTVYLRLAETKRVQATQGAERALAGLKEAIGLEPETRLEVPADSLPEPKARPNRDEMVALALARRGEIISAGVFTEVTCLEAQAQGLSCHKRVSTFAAGSDIHARQVPQGVSDTEYRPGAVPPEMPTLLVGSRCERVQHARDLNARAAAVAEVTRNLVALEAEDAFLHWQEAAQAVPLAKQAAESGDQMANDLTKDFIARLKVKVEDVVNARVLASQARSQYNEFLYKEILALAELERVTAGGFSAGLVELSSSRPTAQQGDK